jgi:hypothetical protein
MNYSDKILYIMGSKYPIEIAFFSPFYEVFPFNLSKTETNRETSGFDPLLITVLFQIRT